ncbi:hypothetical protein FLX56_23355 [Synechococcus moorigangaii CMS01]|nr:hypothetical protein [Synechococcus moorigangaii CMS01]
MHTLLFDYRVWCLAGLHCLMGLLGAVVAWHKGYSFRYWLGWGLLGGTPILLFSWGRSPNSGAKNPEKTIG